MARNLVRVNQLLKISISFRCSILTSVCCASEIHLGRPEGSQTLPSEVTRARWRRHSWGVDPVLKCEFNDLMKGSRSFTAAEMQKAIKHFDDITRKGKVPDYMAVKLASVATIHLGWEEGKKILEMHYMSRGAELRFAGQASIIDGQVEGAIRRIFDNIFEDAYKVAHQFYCRLIDLKFCKVKDCVLRIFVQDLLQKDRVKDAIEEFNYFSHYGKHGSLSGTAFQVLLAAFKKDKELFHKAIEIINGSIESRLQQICILGCVFLTEGFHIQFVDFLRKHSYSISTEDVDFICSLARKCKQPAILDSFVSAHELFKLTDRSRAQIYGSLVEIHGKANNLTGLLKVWEQVVAEKNLNNFRIVILKLGHFYRCMADVKLNAAYWEQTNTVLPSWRRRNEWMRSARTPSSHPSHAIPTASVPFAAVSSFPPFFSRLSSRRSVVPYLKCLLPSSCNP